MYEAQGLTGAAQPMDDRPRLVVRLPHVLEEFPSEWKVFVQGHTELGMEESIGNTQRCKLLHFMVQKVKFQDSWLLNQR